MNDANSNRAHPNEFAGLIGTFTKYGTQFVGGLHLLMHTDEIGQFPEGRNLSTSNISHAGQRRSLFQQLLTSSECAYA